MSGNLIKSRKKYVETWKKKPNMTKLLNQMFVKIRKNHLFFSLV